MKRMKMSKLLRVSEVVQKTGIAKSTVWSWVQEKRFPSPIKLSPRITVWKEDEIDKWIEGICNEKN